MCRYSGPLENSDVSKYNSLREYFPDSQERKPWTMKERESLSNGMKQQLQESLVGQAIQRVFQEDLDNSSSLDDQLSEISVSNIDPENIRLFLPQVDWEQLASVYVPGHSGGDCRARWLNDEDPLINRTPWSKDEEKRLLRVLQHNGLHNWGQISNALGTNRIPTQCLTRFQRSLNSNIMKKEWTKEEDEQLRAIVMMFGENDWPTVAAHMDGRIGSQCFDRWYKSINPNKKRTGRWTVEEDKCLKLAVMVYGPKTWKKIAESVPGRTEVQCRERWCNVVDPSIKLDNWTEEEDAKLRDAISLHGYCWTKVATCVSQRTDNQCWRRWKVLRPDQLAAAQKEIKIRKTVLISNFVGQKKEKSEIGPDDILVKLEDSLSVASNGSRQDVNGESKKRARVLKGDTKRPRASKKKTFVEAAEDSLQDTRTKTDQCPDLVMAANKRGRKSSSLNRRKKRTASKDANSERYIEVQTVVSHSQFPESSENGGALSCSGYSESSAKPKRKRQYNRSSNTKVIQNLERSKHANGGARVPHESCDSNLRLGLVDSEVQNDIVSEQLLESVVTPTKRPAAKKRKTWKRALDSISDELKQSKFPNVNISMYDGATMKPTVEDKKFDERSIASRSMQKTEAVQPVFSSILQNGNSEVSRSENERVHVSDSNQRSDDIVTDSASAFNVERQNEFELWLSQFLGTHDQESPDLLMSFDQMPFLVDPFEVLNIKE